jgi:hypothetical protein
MGGEIRNRRHVPVNDFDALQAGELQFGFPQRARQRLDLYATRDQRAHQVVTQQSGRTRDEDRLTVQYFAHSECTPDIG